MANKKTMSALCMAAMLAASLGSVASASESGVTFPLEESYSFSIMTRAETDSEQDFSKKALVQRMEAATNVQVDYQTIPADQFDEKSKLALSKKGMPDVITKMYIKPYDILSYASKGIFIPIEEYIEEDMPNLKAVLEKRPEVKAAITSADGHIYTLPFINEWSTSTRAGWMSWDLKCPPPPMSWRQFFRQSKTTLPQTAEMLFPCLSVSTR